MITGDRATTAASIPGELGITGDTLSGSRLDDLDVHTTLVLLQFFNAFDARAELGSAFGPTFLTNWRLWAAPATVLALQILAVEWSPAQETFETTGLTATQWAIAVGVASTVLFVEELRRLIAARR